MSQIEEPTIDPYFDFANALGLPIDSSMQQIIALIPERKSYPIVDISKTVDKNTKSIVYTFDRYTKRTWYGKKVNRQILKFLDIRQTNFTFYKEQLDTLEKLFFDYGIHDDACRDRIYTTAQTGSVLNKLFDKYTIYSLPSTIYYIENECKKFTSEWMRFKKYLACVDMLIPKEVISSLKTSMLFTLIDEYSLKSFNTEEEGTYCISQSNTQAINEVLDMFVYSPWCYTFMLYKHLDILNDSLSVKHN